MHSIKNVIFFDRQGENSTVSVEFGMSLAPAGMVLLQGAINYISPIQTAWCF